MNKVHFGAVVGALFYGCLTLAACYQLPSSAAVALYTALATPANMATRQQLTPTPLLTTTVEIPTERQAGSTPATTPTAVTVGAAPAPVGTVAFYEETVTLPTYPLERYQSDAVDPLYNWPYKRFDVERFRLEAPTPEPRTYQLLVLENAYLKLTILPELGGRIWQVIHKPSGEPMFYQNEVVKPTHWGIENQKGWLALGGLEWGLPVVEHGYDWGTKWGYLPLSRGEDIAAVTVFTPRDGRFLNASINISLRADAASFAIEPTLTNLTEKKLAFSFWHDAMLAPGSGKRPSAQLQFVLPGEAMTVHSTNDPALPLPGRRFTWPRYAGRDLSRLGNFRQYLGFFEAPAAHGPFVGVYDSLYDMGAVRLFPATVMRGSKVFALGWQDALTSDNYADDNSMYVELHGGLAPTFADQTQLAPRGQVSWREVWYPVAGIGRLTFANELAALAVRQSDQQLAVGLYSVRPLDGALVYLVDEVEQARLSVQVRPDAPYQGCFDISTAPSVDASVGVTTTIQLQDSTGQVLLTYQLPQDQ